MKKRGLLAILLAASGCSGSFGPEDTAFRVPTPIVLRPEVVQPTVIRVTQTPIWVIGLLGLLVVGLLMLAGFLVLSISRRSPQRMPDQRYFLDQQGRPWEVMSLPSGDRVEIPLVSMHALPQDERRE